LADAFTRAAVRPNLFDYRDSPVLMPDTLVHRAIDRMPSGIRRALYVRAQRGIDRRLLDECGHRDYTFMFVSKAKDIDTHALDTIGQKTVTANWYPETFDHIDTIRTIAPHYHHFFNFDPELVEDLRSKGIRAHYLPFCADLLPVETWPQEHCRQEYGVTFIGSYHPTRYAEREHVLARVADLGLNIWGNEAWLKTSLARYYRGRPSTEEMHSIYRRSKIVINYYLSDVPGSGVNLRPFEITAAGALLLNHDARKDIFRLFNAGTEFIPFHGREDIRQLVVRFLEDESGRRSIARAGFERTRSAHTYDHRIRTVLQELRIS
jgi:spore maturation protein CgeB